MSPVGVLNVDGLFVDALHCILDGFVVFSSFGFEFCKSILSMVGLNVCSLCWSGEGNVVVSIVGTFVSLFGTEVCVFVGVKVGLDEGGSV